ncbi:Methionine gamma-lyase-like protein [Drosera capensis]
MAASGCLGGDCGGSHWISLVGFGFGPCWLVAITSADISSAECPQQTTGSPVLHTLPNALIPNVGLGSCGEWPVNSAAALLFFLRDLLCFDLLCYPMSRITAYIDHTIVNLASRHAESKVSNSKPQKAKFQYSKSKDLKFETLLFKIPNSKPVIEISTMMSLGETIDIAILSRGLMSSADDMSLEEKGEAVGEEERWTMVCTESRGAVCGPASLVNSLQTLILLGPTMNAKVAFELSERIPHLGLRMKEHCRRALEFAIRMKKLGLKVIYPGLEDHPQHGILKSLGNPEYGYGGILCVDLGSEERANQLMYHLQNGTQFGLMAVSLGYYETLMSCSGSSTSSELTDEEKAQAGITPGLVRMSIGYTGTLEQRWAQFERALDKLNGESFMLHKR